MPHMRYQLEIDLVDLLLDQVFRGKHILSPGEWKAAESFVRNAIHQHPKLFSRLQEKLPGKFRDFLQRDPAFAAVVVRAIDFELELALQQLGVLDKHREYTPELLRRIMAARDEALAKVTR